MRNLLGTCSLLLGAHFLAQAPANLALQQAVVSGSCPVGFSARHANGGGLLAVSPATQPRGQGYDITFHPGDARSVVRAKITLHGISGSHVVPAGTQSNPETTESFTLSPAAKPDHHFTAVVYLGKLTAVTSVELNELTYADGTQWHESAGASCQVAPSGYMLVADGR